MDYMKIPVDNSSAENDLIERDSYNLLLWTRYLVYMHFPFTCPKIL